MSTYPGRYKLGQVANAVGGGIAPLDLGNAYTPSSVKNCDGLGRSSARISIVLAGATKIYIRLMDYSDALKPRALQWTRMDTGASANEHSFTGSIDLTMEWSFAKTIVAFAIEKKCDGSANAGDLVSIFVDSSEAA